jgi:hypothetical protein
MAPMHGSCVASVVLISAVHTVLGCQACISFMLPVVSGLPVQDSASLGACADPTVFYIAVVRLVGYLCGVRLQLVTVLHS